MKNTISFIKKHPIFIILLFFVIVILIPMGIHFVYKINVGFPILVTNIREIDMLSYFGNILTFLGTSALGIAVFSQDDEFKKSEDKKRELDAKIGLYKEFLSLLCEEYILVQSVAEKCLNSIFPLKENERKQEIAIFNKEIILARYKAEYITNFLYNVLGVCDNNSKFKKVNLSKEILKYHESLVEILLDTSSSTEEEKRKRVKNKNIDLISIVEKMIKEVSEILSDYIKEC